MADFLDRLRNVYDDHQDRERQKARQDGYVAALHDTRGALLSSALAMQYEWRKEIEMAGSKTATAARRTRSSRKPEQR